MSERRDSAARNQILPPHPYVSPNHCRACADEPEKSKKAWADPAKRAAHAAKLRQAFGSPEIRKKRSELFRKIYADPAIREKVSAGLKKFYSDPAHRKANSESQKKRWTEQARRTSYGAKIREAWNRPGARQRWSASLRARWADPEYKRRWLEARSGPEYKKRQSNGLRAAYANADYRARLAARTKALWQDPVFRARQLRALRDPGRATRTREMAKARWDRKEFRQAAIGKMKAVWVDPAKRAAQSEIVRRRIDTPEGRASFAQAMRKAGISPNRLERRMIAMLDRIAPGRWTANCVTNSVSVGASFPDFIASDGRKLAIDTFGSYHHKKAPWVKQSKTEPVRVAEFARLGWKLLVVWDWEFESDPVALEARLRLFTLSG